MSISHCKTDKLKFVEYLLNVLRVFYGMLLYRLNDASFKLQCKIHFYILLHNFAFRPPPSSFIFLLKRISSRCDFCVSKFVLSFAMVYLAMIASLIISCDFYRSFLCWNILENGWFLAFQRFNWIYFGE